jgi:hypothetical protein
MNAFMLIFSDIEAVTGFTVPNSDYFANYWLSAIVVDPCIKWVNRETLRLH